MIHDDDARASISLHLPPYHPFSPIPVPFPSYYHTLSLPIVQMMPPNNPLLDPLFTTLAILSGQHPTFQKLLPLRKFKKIDPGGTGFVVSVLIPGMSAVVEAARERCSLL